MIVRYFAISKYPLLVQTLPLTLNSSLSIPNGNRNFIKFCRRIKKTRYNSGTIVLAMENAGKLIEDEELREQIQVFS